MDQAGGKLPLFDEQGRRIGASTIDACIRHGWVEPWFANPMKPDWLVCKLTERGRSVAAGRGPAVKARERRYRRLAENVFEII